MAIIKKKAQESKPPKLQAMKSIIKSNLVQPETLFSNQEPKPPNPETINLY